MRVHFDEFAAQLRAHRDREHKRRMLEHRRQGLRRGVALAARLQRLTSWLHDGLVEIGNHHDAAAFVHVHQNLQELTETCFAHWARDIQAMDALNRGRATTTEPAPTPEPEPVLARLTAEARRECVDFIHSVRSRPRFLIDRFSAVSPSQLAALSTSPRFQDLSASVLTSLSQNRGRGSQRKRVQSYSKVLDEYAASFERKNPMSFLLYNCFGPNSRAEETLRLRTWSSVCAGLYVEAGPAFGSIIKQVLSNFCTMQPWRARQRIELFLMDVLQRGAFLLEPVGEYRSKAVLQTHISDTLDTDGAREFFDDAARQLFAILRSEHGGYPDGAIDFCRALLAQLPEQAHASLRSFLAFDWFLDEFLRITITYPENEKMLLQFHISESARVHILHQLWFRAQARVRDVFLPEKQRPVDPEIEASFLDIISQIYPLEPPPDPYAPSLTATTTATDTTELNSSSLPPELPALVLSASDVLHVLDALGQQYLAPSAALDPFLTSSFSAFNSQYARTSRFGRLKRELMVHLEPAYTTSAVHPCQEQWMVLPLCPDGHLDVDEILKPASLSIDATLWSHCRELTVIQEAALRLAFDEANNGNSPPNVKHVVQKSLADRLEERCSLARSASNNLESFYWQSALDALHQAHSPATWVVNDSRIFKSILSRFPPPVSASVLDQLDQTVNGLQHHFIVLKERIAKASLQLGRLKIKMWYVMGVTNSEAYERARNISRALNYMAVSGQGGAEAASRASSDRERPATSASATSSIFEQSRIDTMNILKAPKEHGGPRKLADSQIDMTKRWLDRHNIENFCKGEERIHRFCMEIKILAKNLVGDSLLESPVLWSSDLWAKERAMFDISGASPFHPASSTRAPSVMSETLSSAQFSARPSIRTLDSGSRSLDADLSTSPGRKGSFPALGAPRFNRDLLGSELASSLSPGHAFTATSGESVSTIFSPLPSLSRSATSVSSRSQTPSVYNEAVILKVSDPVSGKALFLERLQHELTCLLLSDLGNPVWSRGSETDSWLAGARQNPAIVQRLLRRKLVASVLPMPELPVQLGEQPRKPKRTPASLKRWSSDDAYRFASGNELAHTPAADQAQERSAAALAEERELQDVLERLSRQVDPAMKLQAVHDFKQLALAFSHNRNHNHNRDVLTTSSPSGQGPSRTPLRRQSLGNQSSALQPQTPTSPGPARPQASSPSENEIVKELKTVLLKLRPATLFRDLQYIAAFISVDALSDSEARRAFWHVGLAALASKDEICRCMVDLADQIVSKDLTTTPTHRLDGSADPNGGESALIRAKDYWILAAREGSPVAQRELAGLYLTHPKIPPIISLPLTLSSEIFKQDIKSQNEPEHNPAHTQALCLALHWMNAAAANGDEIAKRRIQERKDMADIVLA
ncbi:hypothetical protein DV738_g3266, partial [Chaetothyriales sp. CBS 135597]